MKINLTEARVQVCFTQGRRHNRHFCLTHIARSYLIKLYVALTKLLSPRAFTKTYFKRPDEFLMRLCAFFEFFKGKKEIRKH